MSEPLTPVNGPPAGSAPDTSDGTPTLNFSDIGDTTGQSACAKLGYFACEDAQGGGCCPVGYLCASFTCEAPVSSGNTTSMLEPVGPCPGFEGYGACHEDVGGNCCPGYYACLNDGCFFTQKLQIGAVTATLTQSGSTVIATFDKNGPSAATSLARLKTSVSDRADTTSDGVPGPANTTMVPASPGLNQGVVIGISVSVALVVLFIAIGVVFMIRRRRKRSVHKSAENAAAGDGNRQELYDIDAEMQAKKGLSSNDGVPSELPTDNAVVEVSNHDIAWELENTQYTPELSAPHGMSEMEARRKVSVRVGLADLSTSES